MLILRRTRGTQPRGLPECGLYLFGLLARGGGPEGLDSTRSTRARSVPGLRRDVGTPRATVPNHRELAHRPDEITRRLPFHYGKPPRSPRLVKPGGLGPRV